MENKIEGFRTLLPENSIGIFFFRYCNKESAFKHHKTLSTQHVIAIKSSQITHLRKAQINLSELKNGSFVKL